jgi:hypothetical protein
MTNLNFTYNWQNQKYIAGKKNITQIISSNSRPATNGYWDKSQLDELDANAFIPRPIKSWRKQLQPNKIRGGTKSKNIILESEQPGRIISTDNWCNNYTELREIQFFEEIISINEYPPIAMTADSLNVNGNTYGNGNYIASASDSATGLLPFNAFNDTTAQWRSVSLYPTTTNVTNTPTGYTNTTAGPIIGEWIQLQLPNAIKLKSFVIALNSISATHPSKAKLLGSNNPANAWNILYETDDMPYSNLSPTTIYVNANELYTYYRLVILTGGGSQPYVNIVELTFFEEFISINEYPPIAMTQDTTIVNGNTYGNGNYIASASSNAGAGLLPWHTFDDTDNSWRSGSVYPTTSTITNTGPILGEWIQLQIPVAIKLKSFLITPNTTINPRPKQVKLLCSNNPADTWNILYETDLLEYNTIIYVNYIQSYSYYRLVILTTNSNNILITQIVSNISSDKYNNFNTDIANNITHDDIVNCQNGPIGKYICCNPEKNIIKYNQITPINNNFIDTSSYLQSKCNIYTQSYTKSSNIDYFNIYGLALFPNDNNIGGPQLLINSKCYKTCGTNCPSILNKPYNQNLIKKYSIYKPNNREYSIQGAVSSSSRISNLKNNTIAKYNYSNDNNAYGLQNANYTKIIKDKTCCNIDTNKVIMFTFIYSFYSTDTIENINPAIPFITSGNLKIYVMNIYEEIPSIFTIKIQGTYINNNNTFIDGFSLSNTNGYYTYGIDDPNRNILSPNIFTIIQFGGAPLSRAGKQFENLHHTKLTITATDVPTILSNTSLESCFSKCFNFNVNISFFDTYAVTDMSNMFNEAILFNNGDTGNNGNNPLSFTTTSLLTNISGMFQGAVNFNQDLTFTNTSQVTDMSNMFNEAILFNNGDTGNNGNDPLSFTTTSLLTNISGMFQDAVNFNQVLTFTNTSQVKNTSHMFDGASLFNNGNNDILFQPDTSAVTDMSYMFNKATNFNNHNTELTLTTTNVLDMSYMFNGAVNWYKPLIFNNTSSVKNMSYMFANNTGYNANQIVITNFDTSSVTDMSYMFYNSKYFTNGVPPIQLNFITNKVIHMDYMFAGIDYNIPQFNQNFRINDNIYWGNNSNPTYYNFNEYGNIPDIYLPIWMIRHCYCYC